MVTLKKLQSMTQHSSRNQWPLVFLKSPCGYQNYFTSSMMAQTKRIERTLIKWMMDNIKWVLDNRKMNGTVDTLKARDTIQMDLNRLEERDCRNCMNIFKINPRSFTWVMSSSNISTDWRRNVLRQVHRRRTWYPQHPCGWKIWM